MALNSFITDKFKSAFENQCITLMVNAYETSLIKKEIQTTWDENDISAQLHAYVQDDTLRTKWKISTNVEFHIFQDDAEKTKGFASKFPRIDFRFTKFFPKEYVYFMEAKNLKENDSGLKRRYIDTGISNFTSKKYSNGCLLGYLIEGNMDETTKGINYLLTKDGRNSEILEKIESPLHTDYYESQHSVIGVLKHFIFDLTI